MGTRVAITGQPGVGKTTVCRAVVNRLGRSAGGMICSDIADGVVGAGIATKLDIREVIVGAIAGLRTPLKGLAKLMLSVLG